MLIVVYVQQLHAQLEFTNDENVKLLNGMHEGIIIVRQTEQLE